MKPGARNLLMKALGWYRPAAENLTKQERKRRGPELGGLGPDQAVANPYGLSADPAERDRQLASMAKSDLVAPILELYAEEITQPDVTKNLTVWYECNDGEVEKDLNALLERLHVEDYIYGLAKRLAASGNDYQRVLYTKDDGILQLCGTAPGEVTRVWEKLNRRLLGFRWQNHEPDKPIYDEAGKDVFAPWDFIHFRRITTTETEIGQGLLDHLFPLWRKLEMATDSMVNYRLHTMPNRYAFKLDTGNADFTDGMEQVQIWKSFLRSDLMFDSGDPSRVPYGSRHNPAAMDSFLFLPIRGEEDKTAIDTLQGDKDVPDVHDLELLESKFLGGARIPKAYLGREPDSGLAKASLVSQDIRFARMVRVLRRPIVAGFYRLAQLHLSFKGIDVEKYRIKVRMSRISSIEEEINISTLEKQVSLCGQMMDLCQALGIPNRDIVDLVFREYLSVPRWFVDVAKLAVSFKRAVNGEILGGADMGGGGGPMGGGPMGGGPMDDDMGDDMGGLEDFGLPEDDTPGEGGDAEASGDDRPAALVASQSPKPKNLIMEVNTALQFIRNRSKAVRLNESEGGTPIWESADFKKALWEIDSTARDLRDQGVSRRTALIGERDAIDGELSSKERKLLTESVRVGREKIPFQDEEQVTTGEYAESADSHPVVESVTSARKGMRGK